MPEIIPKSSGATLGLSPKVYIPVLGIAVGVLTSWVATGTFDRAEIAAAIAAAWALIGGYLAGPGDVVADTGPELSDLPDSEELD